MSVLAALVDLVLPRRCIGCGSALGALCPACLPEGAPCRGAAGAWAAGVYEAAIRSALLAYKERGRRDLARPLGELLGRAVGCALAPGRSPPGRVVLASVPSARSASAARGGAHVLRLARHAARSNGVRVAPDALRLTRQVADSAGLSTDERARNLANAMTAAPAPPGLVAIIVDDIVTTGATLREARRAMVAAGWPVLGAAAVAATPRRGHSLSFPLASPATRTSVIKT
ncbi:MAG TPA: phosphoribosyltransferase family protein [Jatrophihabitans sp.]|nr:phosphoribosyltransferase family protein [Jatrophihabitans sp.]